MLYMALTGILGATRVHEHGKRKKKTVSYFGELKNSDL